MASPCEMPAGVSGFISFHLMHSIKFHNDRRSLFPIRHKTNISLPTTRQGGVFVFGLIARRGENRARAKREKQSGGLFWCPRACRHAAAWSGVCSRRGSHVPTSLRLGTRAASFFSPRFICHRQRFGEKLVAKFHNDCRSLFHIRHKTNISRISRPHFPPKFHLFFLALCYPLWYSSQDSNLRER